MKYPFHIVDVFSSTPFGGNQLAVLPDAAGLSTEGVQKITREFNFGETTIVLYRTRPEWAGMNTEKPCTENIFVNFS